MKPTAAKLRKTGIDPVGDAPWGTHFCHFYDTQEDLIDLLVPYFKAGLQNNEFCMWVTSAPLGVADAERALRRELPDLDDYIKRQQIEILDYSEWYTKGGKFDADRVLEGWIEKERWAIERGFEGLRLTGNTFWLEQQDWGSFTEYEATVNSVIGQYRMIALCSYAVNRCGPREFMDVVRNHQLALVKREGEWELIASSGLQQVRQALLEERTRYQTLFEQAPDGVVIIDPETTRVVEFNGAAHRQLGYSREEFASLRLSDIEAAEEPAATAAHVQEVLRVGRDDFETQHRTKNGETRDVLVTVQTAKLSGRHLFHCIFRDITERNRAQQQLAEQRWLLDAILDRAVDAIMVCDAEGKLLLVNAAARRMTGQNPGGPIDTARWGTLYDPEGQPVALGDVALIQALRGEVTVGLERHVVRPDGNSYDVLVSAAPVRAANGEIMAAVSTVTDITERKRAEEGLRETRDYLEKLIDYANAPIIVWDPSFTISRFNHAFEWLTGRPASEVIGQRLEVLFPENERAASMEQIARTVRGEFWELIEIPILHRSGEIRYVLWNSANITGADGRTAVATIAQGTDITERKLAEEALRQTRDYLEKLIDYANAPIIVWDPSFTITRFNRAFERLTGRPASEVIGQRLEVLFPEHERAASMEQIARTVLGEFWELIEIPILHRSGEVRYVLWNSANITGADGRTVVATIAQGTDISERKQAEESLRESREDLKRAQAVAHIGNWHLDVRRNELLWSDEAYRIFGIPEGTPLTYETFLAAVHPDDREYVDEKWAAALRGEPYDIEHRIIVGDSVRWVREQAELESDEHGTLLGGFGTVQDITERKRAEEEVERLRTEFTGIVAHELKTPLTAIKGSAATALGGSRPLSADEGQELFQIIDEQADRLRDLVDDLLDMTRIEAGTLSVAPEPVELRALLEEARATFVHGGGCQPVELEAPADLPTVNADRHRVVQVLANLLSNASQSSAPSEPITIAAKHDAMHVTVRVQDRGRGIPREKLPLLFKKFSQIHEGAGRRLGGTGLGLAVCKGIVEAHGGRIWAESGGEGQGATFSFTLPVAGEATVKTPTDGPREAVQLAKVRRKGKRTRVLAVDDEPEILRYLQRSLDDAGYEAIVTSDPSQVTKLVELEEPDLLLLDLRLPTISGFELLQRIREFSGVPIIFLTASDRDEDTVQALEMGADDYITKPFSPSELLARIGAALRRRLLPDVAEVRPPFVLDDLTINFTERRVTLGGRELSLSPTEYKILYELATHAGRVLTHDQLLRQVWGPEYSGETELVRSFVRNLRRRLGDDAQHPRFILTERHVGYRMPAP